MEKEQFKQKFIEVFNERIKGERKDISEEYRMENAKILISLKEKLDEDEINRCYDTVIDELIKQKISVDYLNEDMVGFSEEITRKRNALFLYVKSVKSRKPLKNKQKEFATVDDIKEQIILFSSFFNKNMRSQSGKVNEFDDFDFVVTHGEFFDKESLYNKFREASQKLDYKLYNINPSLMSVEEVVPNEQYIVRYVYGE